MRQPVPVVVAALLVVAVGGGIVVGGATSTAVFGSFNSDWEGTSDLRTLAEEEDAETAIIDNTSEYEPYGGGDVAFVIAPDRDYEPAEAANIRAFLDRGGTVVVAVHDGQPGIALLDAVGAEARPIGPVLRDEREYYQAPPLPVADPAEPHPLIQNDSTLTLNYGTAVAPNNATVLFASSEFSYLDRDGSETLNGNESVGSRPVVTAESVSDGEVILVSDPSVFINVMQGEPGNEAVLRGIIAASDTVVIDVSHSASLPPFVAALLTVRSSAPLQLGLGIGGVAAVGLFARLTARRQSTSDTAGQAKAVHRDDKHAVGGETERYPVLRDERLRQLTEGVIPEQPDSDDDE